MSLQIVDKQSVLDERLNVFKKGFMSDIIFVMDHKLKEFETCADEKLDKFKVECKDMLVEHTDKFLKVKIGTEIGKKGGFD